MNERVSTFEAAKEKLAEYAQLKAGWDSYGAGPITSEAIASATSLARLLEGSSFLITPTSPSGIDFEWWINDNEHFSVEFNADGKIDSVYFVGAGVETELTVP